MATIGSVTCDTVRGTSKGLGTRTETWEVMGLDGYGALRMGRGDAPGEWFAVYYGSRSQAVQWARDLQLLQGTIVTVTEDTATTITNVLITQVGLPTYEAALLSAVGRTTRATCVVRGLVTA